MTKEISNRLPVLRWTPDLSNKFWRRLAGTEFLEHIAFSRYAAPYLVNLVREYFPENPRIIDCGSGFNLYLVRELLRQGFSTAFYEPSMPANWPVSGLDKHEHFLGGVNEIGSNEFDVAFLCEVIEHLFDDQIPRVLGDLKQGLRSNGLLIVTTPMCENLFESSRVCPLCQHLFHPWGHVRSFTPDALEKLLGQYGFQCEALWNVDFSGTRQWVEELLALKDRIARLLEEATAAAPRSEKSNMPDDAPFLANRFIAAFQDLKDSKDTRDPKRCQIGLGGNIVAVARKT